MMRSLRLAALLLALLPGRLHAQGDAPAAARTGSGLVAGRVVNGETGAVVRGALVRIPALRRSALSGPDGVFRLGALPTGDHAVIVTHIGHRTSVGVWRVTGAGLELEVQLREEPLLLAGLTASADRFRARARSSARAIREFSVDELAHSASSTAEEFIRGRGGLVRASCGALSTGGTGDCVIMRGAPVRPCVIVDERPAFGGMSELSTYRPQDLYRIDIVGSVIQVYTVQYARWLNGRNATPISADVLTLMACTHS